MAFSKKNKKKKKQTGFKLILHQLPHAITYLSDIFIFLMVITWMFYIINGTFAGWYSMIVNTDSTVFTDLKDACTIPLVTGGIGWLLKCALNHYNSMHKNGKRLPADFPNEDEFDDENYDFGDVEDYESEEEEFFEDDMSIEDDPDMEVEDDEYDESIVEDDDLGDEEDITEDEVEEDSEETSKGEEEYFVDTKTDDE